MKIKNIFMILCVLIKDRNVEKKNLVEIINLGKKMLDNKNIIVNCCYW